jgi:hypothetical protein
MSGEGVWLVPQLIGEPYPPGAPFTQPKLIGFFIEHRRPQSVLIATKIHFHIDKIIEKYPKLALRKQQVVFGNSAAPLEEQIRLRAYHLWRTDDEAGHAHPDPNMYWAWAQFLFSREASARLWMQGW